LNKIVKRQIKSLGNSRDDGKPRICALSLLDLCQCLGRDLCAEGEFGARHALLNASVPQHGGHRAP
jgi:hypothetical protein